jgi:two-component system LytT family response regulator
LGVRHWRTSHERQIESSLISEVIATPAEIEKPVFATTFAVRTAARVEIVRVEEVLWIAASQDYVELHTKRSTHLLRETLPSLMERLNGDEFMRIHRSRVVRIDQIRELTPLENGEYRIALRDGSEHRSSRTYARAVTAWVRSGTVELTIRSPGRSRQL